MGVAERLSSCKSQPDICGFGRLSGKMCLGPWRLAGVKGPPIIHDGAVLPPGRTEM